MASTFFFLPASNLFYLVEVFNSDDAFVICLFYSFIFKSQFQSGRKVILPHVIEATTSVEEAALIFLCDAFYHEVDTTRQSEGGYREVLKLHRKLAPYKTVFSTVNASSKLVSCSRLFYCISYFSF